MDERDLLKQQAVRQNQGETLEVADATNLNEASIATINESRKMAGSTLTYKDQSITLDQVKPIGTGGSKQVYSAQIGERHYALCIPAAGIDHPKVILKKWQAVVKEPANTQRIRNLGLYANEVCQLVPIKINGHDFPALAMKRYQDLSYEVRDSKNPKSSSIGKTKVLKEGQDITEVMETITTELAILIKNNVKLSEDSFNLAVVKGKAHLYFNDLGSAKFETIAPEFLERYIDAYLDFAIVAFITGLTEAEFSPIADQFEYEALKEKLKGKLLEKLS